MVSGMNTAMCCQPYGPLNLSPLITQQKMENGSEWEDECSNIVPVDAHTLRI